jgi:hypothetical protein
LKNKKKKNCKKQQENFLIFLIGRVRPAYSVLDYGGTEYAGLQRQLMQSLVNILVQESKLR